MRARGSASVVLVVIAGAMLASCGGNGDRASGESVERTAPSAAAPTTTTAPESTARATVSVYLLRGEQIQAAHRHVASTAGIGSAAIGELLSGPTAGERAAGLRSAIPVGTRLRGLTISEGTATVDLTRNFETGGGSLSMRARLAQVVFTLTRFPTVRRVALRLDGQRVESIGGEGVPVVPALDRRAFEDLSPAILIESPAIGDTIASPLSVTGTANTFEATVSFRVLDERGRKLTEAFTTATSGTGTRGTFKMRLEFQAPSGARSVTVMAFESSAATGADTKVVRVTLPLR